jgi:zinc and cadmium transporter
MDQSLVYGLLAALVIGLLSLGGALTFAFSQKLLSRLALYLVAFSTGALIGGAFFHLLPEALELSDGLTPFMYLIVGISVFFVLERYLKWHHCHEDGECEVHTFTHMSLVGDGLHNFIDGLVIISAFSVSPELGVVTSVAMAAHELPQELGDFGVLIHGGFTRSKALFWNFASSLTALAGVLAGYFLINLSDKIVSLLLPFAAGGFIYIAMSDLVPELHKEPKISKSALNFLLFLAGIAFMAAVKLYGGQ